MPVLTNVTAVTMDAERRIVTDASITIDGGRIVSIDQGGAGGDIDGRAGGDTDGRAGGDIDGRAGGDIDGRGMVAIPGLIDTHAHADQSLLRGRADDLEWVPFLADWIDPYLARRSPETLLVAYQLGMAEMLLGGTTCFVSPNVDPRDDLGALVALVERMGMRAVLARWVDSLPALETVTAVATDRIQVRVGLDVP